MSNCTECGTFCCTNIHKCEACIARLTVQVGKIDVATPFDLSASFESAAAYHEIHVAAGEYPILSKVSRYDGKRYLAIAYTGKVIASGYGAKRYDDKIGTVDTVTVCPDKYQLEAPTYHRGVITITDATAFAAIPSW